MELQEQLDGLKKDLQSENKAVVDKAIERIVALENKESFNIKENDEFITVKQELEALKTKQESAIVKTFAQEIEEKREDINALKGGLKSEIVVKADTFRSSVADNEYSENISGIGQLGHKKLTMRDLCNVLPISGNNDNGIVRYSDWDADTTVRAAAEVSEGGTFPESTAKWEQKTVALDKIGDTIPVSEELMEDSAAFANELGLFLSTNVAIKENSYLTTDFVAACPAYTPVASGIQDASVFDLLVVLKDAISESYGSKYVSDFVIAPNSVIQLMKLKKDDNNNYVMPPFVDNAGNVVDGMRVVENNDMSADTLAVGDSRYMRLYAKGGLVLSKDTVASQFAEDMITLKARQRELFLIREADKTGFLKVTSVSDALDTIATTPA